MWSWNVDYSWKDLSVLSLSSKQFVLVCLAGCYWSNGKVGKEWNKCAKGVRCETCKATLDFPVQIRLSGQKWLRVIGVCYCLGLICRRGPFLIWWVIMVGCFSESTTPGIMSHCYISSVWTSSLHESHTGDLFYFVQIFVVIGATSGVWQHIVIFAWWHVHVILRGSTYYNIYYRRNFRQQFPVPK